MTQITFKMAASMNINVLRKTLEINLFQKLFGRCYSKNVYRRPLAVITPEEERDKLEQMGVKVVDPRVNAHSKYLPHDDPVQKNMRERNKTVFEKKQKRDQDTYNDKILPKIALHNINNIQYSEIKDDDISKKFSQVMLKVKSKKEREKKRETLLEGKKIIIDALKANIGLKSIYFSKTDLLENFPSELVKCPVYKVPYRSLKVWADTETPQGIMAIIDIPKEGELAVDRQQEVPVTMICENIRDPGNMGTLIRTAAAVGCHRFITMKGCVDVWDPKVLRAGAGGHFRVPIINSLSWEYVVNYVPDNSSLFIADSRRPSEWALEDVTSPHGEVNSEILNTRKNEEFLQEDQDSELTIDKSFSRRKHLELYEKVPMNVSLFSEVDFTSQGHTVLIMGGDGTGISVQARKLAFDNYGQFVMLPMATGINSLNSSITGSILLFEIQKQYCEKMDKDEKVVKQNSN